MFLSFFQGATFLAFQSRHANVLQCLWVTEFEGYHLVFVRVALWGMRHEDWGMTVCSNVVTLLNPTFVQLAKGSRCVLFRAIKVIKGDLIAHCNYGLSHTMTLFPLSLPFNPPPLPPPPPSQKCSSYIYAVHSFNGHSDIVILTQ